jgi:S-(hydroxymethyl)glutathione dehydrogenase/alcohol dehydrogenase
VAGGEGKAEMRAAVMVENDGPLVIEDLVASELGDHDVEVRVEASGVCHSDLTMLGGLMPPPTILGHEGAGTVLAVGRDVSRVKVGDRVIASFTPACGSCWYCLHDASQHCKRAFRLATTIRCHRPDGTPVLSASGLGTFGETFQAHEASVVAVQTDLPFDQLALMGCAAMTGVGAALNTARVQAGDIVAVIGCGGVGQFVIQGARIAGAAAIVAVDPSEPKRAFAASMGATHALDPSDDGLVDALRALSGGRGVDVAFEVVGRPELVRDAFDSTRPGGTTVIVGMPALDAEVSLPMFSWFHEEKRVVGCNYGSAQVRRDFPRLVALTEAGLLDVGSAVTAVRPLDDVNAALDDLRAGVVVRTVLHPGS